MTRTVPEVDATTGAVRRTLLGVAAPVLLIVLRFLQGFSAGGEISGAVSFVAEHSPVHRRGLHVGMISVGAVLGTLLGSLVPGVLLLTLSTEAMLSWGWRLPLLLALPMGVIGLYIRRRLDETPHFLALRQEHSRERNPVVAALRGHGITYNLSVALFGGSAPYLLTWPAGSPAAAWSARPTSWRWPWSRCPPSCW